MEFSAGKIAALLGGKLIGKAQAMVSDVAPIESAQPHHLSFITDAKYMPYLENTQAGAILVSEGLVANSESLRAIRRLGTSGDSCRERTRRDGYVASVGIESAESCQTGY